MFYNNDINNYYDLNTRQSNTNIFHEHINGGGANFTMFSGDSMDYVGNLWNDQISSVTVAPRTLVILFEHRGFKGATYRLTNNGDSSYLFNLPKPWNDITSSIVTYRLG
ncbi:MULTISPECIES: hypothetical protein [Bacillus cereus group]|uniref:hypothetical protein n=1 Tax=Bacillus cereus group TaxID=86661 RepID=UPI000BF87B87|nr:MULTISPECIES: hypothetical protein [Bacillus cereus group]MCU4998387.1 hypothetical protein [Bacillus cereus]PES29147.1 hypothetical protein CN496_14895 [Bacillus cereus]PET82301.1 hypothetical protein CN528_11045 [Bacillus cereus]PFS01430.1 hypothetical protein COK60_26135 [Bacillus thuringiensis]PGS50534.1 hypothetical protein COC66_27635 [Bacillus cereus]